MDASLNKLDTAYGGMLYLDVSSGSVNLTTAQASNPVIYITGTLHSNTVVGFPPTVAGRRIILPGCTMGSFYLWIRANNGSDGVGVYFWSGFGVPYGIVVTPNRVYWDYGSAGPGTIIDVPTGWPGNGYLPCDGRYVSMTQHDLLYDAIGGIVSGGSFRLPDYRGSVLAMADQIGAIPAAGPYSANTGNRGVLNSWGIQTFAGQAQHTLLTNEMASHTHSDSGHGHPGSSQDAHQHGGVQQTGVGSYYTFTGNPWFGPGVTDWQAPAVHIATGYANISYAGGNAPHDNVQPTTTTMKMIKW